MRNLAYSTIESKKMKGAGALCNQKSQSNNLIGGFK
jgi:hypothetical protein